MSVFTGTRWAARQTVRAIIEFKGLFLMALSLAGLALTIPFFLATLAWSLSSQVFDVPTQAEVTIFADRSAGEQTVRDLAKAVSENTVISSVRIVPKSEALEMVNKSLGLKAKDAKSKQKAQNNPLPDIVIATVANNVSSEELAAAADAFRQMPNVDLVAYDDSWQRYLNALYTALSLVLGILGSVVFLLVLLVIFASVRLTTNAQKDEIRALSLFGATASFIRRPYSWRGFLTLMLSAVLSLGVTATAVSLLAKPIADFAGLYGVTVILRMPSADWCALYVALAALLGYVVGSFAAKDAIARVQNRRP